MGVSALIKNQHLQIKNIINKKSMIHKRLQNKEFVSLFLVRH